MPFIPPLTGFNILYRGLWPLTLGGEVIAAGGGRVSRIVAYA